MINSDADREVRKVLGLILQRSIEEDENVSRQNEPRWDSLKHVEIVFALEDVFSVHFSEEEMAALDSIETIVRAVER